jgi:hypothetical protein
MAGAETAGLLAIAMLLGQGLIELIKFLIGKFADKNNEKGPAPATVEQIQKIIHDAVKQSLLHEPQAGQLRTLYEMHMKFDNDGTPIWYVPRSWNETMKDIVDKLYKVTETQNKTLALIERLERRVEQQDK